MQARVSNVQRLPGDLWFYEKRGADDNQFKLYVRHGVHGAERLLIDPDALAKAAGGAPHAMSSTRRRTTADTSPTASRSGGSEEA